MPTQDISRFLHQPEKHYAGVRMQQGRVLLDSDWNERSSIEAEDLRRTISELACSKGTPNAGMSISNVAVAPAAYDFHIANGSYYLGGMRLVVDAADDWETYQTQSDWLQVDGDDGALAPPAAPNDRIDLIYVCAWEQPVCAVEDSELFEVALGGRDTSVRMRRMRRFASMIVEPATNPPSFDSADGLEALIASLETQNATFDRPTSELLSEGLLLVEATEDGSSTEDPCNVPEVEGYVGAENRAIRVELRAGTKLTWGFDNASPLYRVKVGAESPYDTLTFITEPADLPAMPRAGQVVEILRWGSKLPNVEKVAEAQGTLHKVETTYDPTTRQLVLDPLNPVTASWVTWLADHPEHHNLDDDEDERQYLYLRVWDRGADITSNAEITYVVDSAVPLGDTGLQVTVTEDGMPGDYWVIAARPSTPDRFVPWNLGTAAGVPPHGPRRFYAPLALIRWTDGVPTIDDARTRLRTLCEGGCCKVTVGDGKESHGQVDTLQDAIDLLAGTGGKICVLPGVHEGLAVLDGLTDIVIEGCGSRSILTNPRPEIPSSDPDSIYAPVLKIVDCERILVKDLRIEAYHAFGVLVDRSEDEATCSHIRLDHLDIQCLGIIGGNVSPGVYIYEMPRSGIAVLAASQVDILDCKVSMINVTTKSYGVVLCGTHLRMHRCTVLADAAEGAVSKAAGGINIRSTSRDVEVVSCHIEGGKFSGIDLGHRLLVERHSKVPLEIFEITHTTPHAGGGAKVTADGPCADLGDSFEDSESDDPAWIWVPAGPVEDIRIHDNVIRGMGSSGISTSVFFPAAFDWDGDNINDGVPRFIVAAEFDIARNLIEGNFQSGTNPVNLQNFDRAAGGIALSACINAWIHENTIRNNGTGFHTPVCGIGIVAAQNAVIEDNRIIDNGERHPGGSEAWLSPGLRGGIVIWEATTVRSNADGQPTFPSAIPFRPVPWTNKSYSKASSESAVIVRGNEVSQPVGKALWIRRGFGPITVTGNSFEGFGDPVNGVEIGTTRLCWNTGNDTLAAKARGTVIEIIDYAKAIEIDWSSVTDEIGELAWTDEAGGEVDGGGILFADNSVKSTWNVSHVQACAVFVCSFDQASVCGNSVWTTLNQSFSPSSPFPVAEFLAESPWLAESRGYYVFAVYVGGTSTASAVGNRIVHEKYGAVFSLVVGPPTVLSGGFHEQVKQGVMLSSNVGTHAFVGQEPVAGPTKRLNVNNISVFPVETAGVAFGVEIPDGSRDITVVFE